MAEPLADQVLRKIGEVCSLYHRLILMVGPAGSGKTSALQEVSARASAPLINVNLELSRRMLDLTERQRALQAPRLLGEIVGEAMGALPAATLAAQAGLVLLDNIEILFDVHLKQDPLRLLQGLSRNKMVVAAWNGSIVGGHMTYAVPGHPEYRRYPIRDLSIVDASSVERHASSGRWS
ncbi:MAG: BREX-3 system P-loop-containing protein BrxF [Dissulfurimicrobium sp.]|uniref:BREX-3 system P-loop-containing protein BrxF n=1 Tax=Dissulfurimicrobium TaxID=1769732 RepID=UPI001EDC2421|nr:BREX-3 system P-loop-containing protein BrxF [Dissulfurimicrobium hydrothermale]UKL13969.1 BREX-3 system P-loop-containing protein BrxF [Dissulfurimicrobium hydrothermale]